MSGARSFTLQNEFLRFEIALDGEHHHLLITRADDSRAGHSWTRPSRPAPLYRLRCATPDGRMHELSGATGRHVLEMAEERTRPGGGREVWLRFRPDGFPLRFTYRVQVRPGYAVVRQWFELSNLGEAPVRLLEVPILTLRLAPPAAGLDAFCGLRRYNRGPDWYDWRHIRLQPGVADRVESGWMKDGTWLGLTAPDDSVSLVLGWETNAPAFHRFGDLYCDGDCWTEGFLRPDYALAPGATFVGPAGFFAVAPGGLDEVCYRAQRFVDEVLAWPLPDERFPYVAFNSWGYGEGIDAGRIADCLDLCERAGIELFVVDFGWEDPDWNPRKDRFPYGLRPIAREARRRGMKFGIHFSWGNLSSLSRAFQEHPEWGVGHGMWAYRDGATVHRLALGNPAAREWIARRIIEVIDENEVDYFLTDTELFGFCDPAAQPVSADNEYVTIAEGFDAVLAHVRRERPGVLIEHCDNGGSLMTYKMVQQHVTSIGADANGPIPERIAKFRLSHMLPPRYLDSYAADWGGDNVALDAYAWRSFLLGGPLILMNRLQELAQHPSGWEVMMRHLALFKRLRRQIRESKVLHLLPPQIPARLGHGWDGWDAIGAYHPAQDKAVVFVFRLGEVLDERLIPLHGLSATSRYRITFEDRADVLERSGAELMRDGLRLRLPAPGQVMEPGHGVPRASEIVYLEAVPHAGSRTGGEGIG